MTARMVLTGEALDGDMPQLYWKSGANFFTELYFLFLGILLANAVTTVIGKAVREWGCAWRLARFEKALAMGVFWLA